MVKVVRALRKPVAKWVSVVVAEFEELGLFTTDHFAAFTGDGLLASLPSMRFQFRSK